MRAAKVREMTRLTRLRAPMQHVDSDVRPEFAEDIRERIAAEGVSVLLGNASGGSRLAGIIGYRNTLSDTPAQNFGDIEAVVPMIARRDEDAAGGIGEAIICADFTQSNVALIIKEYVGQINVKHIIAVRIYNPC